MTIDNQCSVTIPSFDADPCTSLSQVTLPIIVGAALGGVVLLTINMLHSGSPRRVPDEKEDQEEETGGSDKFQKIQVSDSYD